MKLMNFVTPFETCAPPMASDPTSPMTFKTMHCQPKKKYARCAACMPGQLVSRGFESFIKLQMSNSKSNCKYFLYSR